MSSSISVDCPVCGFCTARRSWQSTEPLHKLLKCDSCSHIWQHPLKIGVEYNQKYITERYDSYDTTDAMSWLRLGLVRSFSGGGRLLDIGYGNGSFIKIAEKAKFEAFGYDVHGLGERYGVKEASLDEGDWEVVTLFDSIEHFDDLNPIKSLDKRASFIIVSTPYRPHNFPFSLEWKHFRPGEHLHYFDKTSLSTMFPSHDLILITDIEDAIRGPCKVNGQHEANNIMTCVFGSAQREWISRVLK